MINKKRPRKTQYIHRNAETHLAIPQQITHIRCPLSRKSCLIFIGMLFLVIPTLHAAQKQIVNGGPNDYFDPDPWIKNYVHLVEKHHLLPAKEQVIKGYTTSDTGAKVRYIWEEIDFTLRWFPNHPEGLQFMAEWLPKFPHPPGKTVEYYFEKAVSYKPTPEPRPVDGIPRMLYAIYLHKKGRLDEAEKYYLSAMGLMPENSELHYDLGLLYADRKDYHKALEHAKLAYRRGYPLPGLRHKLITAGVWKEDSASPPNKTLNSQ